MIKAKDGRYSLLIYRALRCSFIDEGLLSEWIQASMNITALCFVNTYGFVLTTPLQSLILQHVVRFLHTALIAY